ncbi:MAG: hypothetical protein CL666_00765 [Balneola sp.]|nr:hypothetical protein [Balneola sp.]|tara:strand:- start:3348 stop:3635 length:288 start_codon:yes stop_codon:yes gene_type:complete
MAEKLPVIWSRESSAKVEEIKAYLLEEWSKKEVESFLKELKSFEDRIELFPKLYPASQKRSNMRKAVITKQQSVIYQVLESTIQIVTILDNRQDN